MKVRVTGSTGHQPDWDIDLKFGQGREEKLRALFAELDADETKLEVKTDRQAVTTGNVYVECMQKPPGHDEYKPSGIATTGSPYWAFLVGRVTILVPSDALLWAARERADRLVDGGLNGDCPTRGVLLSLAEIVTLFNESPFE